MRTEIRRALAIALALTAASCGGGDAGDDTASAQTTGDETPATDEVPSPPSPWDSMDHDAQAQWMFTEVVPRMQAQFQEHDAERYAEFSCATCHGPNAEAEGFEMPTNSLPALPATGTEEQRAMVNQYRPMATFMFQRVLPTMQTLIGAPDYDEETHEGFSCFACHPHAGDEGSTLIRLDEAPADPAVQ